MRRAVEISPKGSWPSLLTVGTVTLQFSDRHRRRIRLTDDAGQEFLLDLSKTKRFSEGDGLILENGEVVLVRAAPEEVIDIICKTPEKKTQIAWHLGNRHTAVEILPKGNLRILRDHVLEQMVISLGATVRHVTAPFEPEGGAYEHKHSHKLKSE